MNATYQEVPLPLALGLLTALLIFIPYVGSILSAIPAVLIAFLYRPVLALWVVVMYTGVHLLL